MDMLVSCGKTLSDQVMLNLIKAIIQRLSQAQSAPYPKGQVMQILQ
jgi:hypothetical protein